MFDNNIKTEPIPERVYELCKMVAKDDIEERIARDNMEPKAINPSGASSYFPSVREVCIQELKLIEKDGDNLKFVGDKKILKDMDSFRKYCNSVVFSNKESDFYKIAMCFLESNDTWLRYKTLTDINIRRAVQEDTNISLVTEQMMLGMRFWISFLGFGYIQEGSAMYFLPNMHIALQDFCEYVEFEKNKEYSVAEFIGMLDDCASVAFTRAKDSKIFNLAMSTALRQMHDKKEIILKNNLDSKETWHLYYDETHELTDKFTHIVYKGVKRG